MQKLTIVVATTLAVLMAVPAVAELQNVEVGGEVRIHGNYVRNTAVRPGPMEVRAPAFLFPGRAIGDMASYVLSGNAPGSVRFNGAGILSPLTWHNQSNSWKFVDQRTTINVKADFTSNVCAFIELESYDIWGQDFRSNYVTGADFRTTTADDLEMFQSYIQVEEFFDLPLRVRIGRQEMMFGNEWLVGNNDYGPLFFGISFDGIRLTYTPMETLTVDAWWSKLADRSPIEEDGDVDFYGVYASYTGIEPLTLEAYAMYLRDARSLNDTNFIAPLEALEAIFSVDDYAPTELWTIGGRVAGRSGPVDFNVEAAYQFGDAGQVGYVFKPFLYGDDNAEYGTWGATFQVGYTADCAWNPRVYVGGDYYGGEDHRSVSFLEYLNPFAGPQASVSFNRLFSDYTHTGFIDLNEDASNMWMAHVGVQAHPSEKLMADLKLTFFESLGDFESPAHLTFGRFEVPIAPGLSFWTDKNADELGWETDLVLVYEYSEDLSFLLHWSHMFASEGLGEGQFTLWNGLLSSQGEDDDDGDYVEFETKVKF